MLKRKSIFPTVVTTKQELKMAIQRKDPNIIIRGDLVKDLKCIKRLKSISDGKGVLAAFGAVEISVLILSGAVSVAIIIGILSGYNVEFRMGDTEIKLTAK